MKAVIYARFSPRANEEECQSIEKQLDYCHKYCDLKQYEIIGEFTEPGISAANMTGRPEFNAAVSLACKNKAILLGYAFDRLFRSTKDAIITADLIEKAGANLQTADGPIDTTTPTGRVFFTLMAAFAQLERETTADRTSKAMLYYQRQGRRMSHKLPYGWQPDPDDKARMIEHEGEQVAVRRIVELSGRKHGPYEIASLLASEGLVSRSGKRFGHSTILRILKRATSP